MGEVALVFSLENRDRIKCWQQAEGGERRKKDTVDRTSLDNTHTHIEPMLHTMVGAEVINMKILMALL